LTVEVPAPRLWWTHDLGEQPLYACAVELVDEGVVVSREERVFGFREVRQDADWTFYLNGKRLFMRGTNYLSDQFLSQVDVGVYERDIQMMLDANMNMIRVFAHRERDEFYRLCDEKGLLVFQDLPFQWGYRSDLFFIRRAEDVVTRYVNSLLHHPCIALWCCHSESRLYDYNKLDQAMMERVRRLDPTRPVQRNSVLAAVGETPKFFRDLKEYGEFIPPHLTVHWVGWYWGELRDKEHYNPLFVSEYGTQSVPCRESLEQFIPAQALWPPDWDVWRRHGFQTNVFEKNIGPFPAELDELIEVTQQYQARFYKEHTEALRRKKWAQVKGILQFHFVNGWPAIDWSMIDYYRRPKLAYEAVKKAFAPLLLSFKGDVQDSRATVEPWLVNDHHRRFEALTLQWQVLTPSGEVLHEETLGGLTMEADSAKRLRREVTLTLPEGVREAVAVGRLFAADGALLTENDALLYPLSKAGEMESAADAKVGL
jgi:beta-mannosidase